MICSACGIDKPLNEFPRNGTDKDGNTRHRPDCKECYGIRRRVSKKKHNKFINNTKHRTGEISTLRLADWRDALIHFRGRCAYCGARQSRRIKLTKDHVVPVIKGGMTVRRNIIPACTSCNSSKSDNDWGVWFKSQRFYNVERAKQIAIWIGLVFQ